jgi:hypothetical protein
MHIANQACNENYCHRNYYSHKEWHINPNQICCPYFKYCPYMNQQMNYRSVNTNRTYDEQTGNVSNTLDIENSKATSPNIYKFKNNFNIYLQKNELNV